MLTLRVLVFVCALAGALADYECLCAYAVETKIYEGPATSSNILGYMYEFDCKPAYNANPQTPGWQTVATDHQVGYVVNSTSIEIQVCQGSVPGEDKFTGTLPPSPTTLVPTTPTTQAPTTQPPTTPTPTTPAPTTPTTQAPTTQAPTTPTTPAPTTQAPTTPAPITSTTQAPTTTTTATVASTPKPTTTTTTQKPTTTTTTPKPTTTTTTPKPTTTTTTPKPTTTTTTPKPTTTTTTPRPTTTTKTTTTTTTTPRPTTTTTTRKPTTTRYITRCPASVTSRTKLSYIYKHRSYCYEFRDRVQDWYHAKQDCQSHGGFLMSIQNEDEQNFIHTMLNSLGQSQPVWLGLYDETHEEVWQWVSGIPLKYTNWMPGRYHDKYHSFENCGLYVPLRKGQWDDIHCKGLLLSVPATHPWICQYHVV